MSLSYKYSLARHSWRRCAARFSKFWPWPKCYFLHPFLDLVSVSYIHCRGHKRDVHDHICVNHVIIVSSYVPLRDHITPHYVNLGLIKLPHIVKLNTCQLIYDHFVDKKPLNFTLASVSEQHNYDTRSASLQHLNPTSLRINIRKFCPTVIGCYYCNDIPSSIREKTTKKLFKRALFNYYLAQY